MLVKNELFVCGNVEMQAEFRLGICAKTSDEMFRLDLKFWIFERQTGFEPATFGLGSQRSAN